MRTCSTLSISQKRKIIDYGRDNPRASQKDLAAWASITFAVKVSVCTISRIFTNKDKLLSLAAAGSVKRVREAEFPEVELLLYDWFLHAQEERVSLSDDLISEKAIMIHEALKQKRAIGDCKFSKGWVHNFKKRHNISSRILHGEGDTVILTEDVWDDIAALKARLTDYEPKDIFNFDETALFYKLQPNRTLRDRVQQGEKRSKDRITIGFTCNSDGSVRLPPLIINRFKRPRAFAKRNIKVPSNLGIEWYANRKAWMDKVVFHQYLIKFDQRMQALGRKKVILLVDNAAGHSWLDIVEQLKVTRVLALPPNTTARFQPLDAGIIKSFKCQYRRLFMRKQLRDFEAGQKTALDVYDAVIMTEKAWMEGVTKATITNCWQHVGLVQYVDNRPQQQRRAFDLNESLVDFDLNVQLDAMGEELLSLARREPVTLTVDEWLDADIDSIQVMESADHTLASLLNVIEPEGEKQGGWIEPEPEDEAEEEDIGIVDEPVSRLDAQDALETLNKFMTQADEEVYGFIQKIRSIQGWLLRERSTKLTQSTLDEFLGGNFASQDSLIEEEELRQDSVGFPGNSFRGFSANDSISLDHETEAE